MARDDYYQRVDQLTQTAMEKLSLLTPSLTDFILAHYHAIREAAERHLAEEERTRLTNLSFFYFLASCIDFLFFLHLRHRSVHIYEHELEHILSVMVTHARQQREAFRALTGGGARPGPSGTPGTVEVNWTEFERELRRYGEELGGGGKPGSAA